MIKKKFVINSKPCIDNTAEVVKVNKFRLVKSGQGEGETRWKGWAWKLLLFIYVIRIKLEIL